MERDDVDDEALLKCPVCLDLLQAPVVHDCGNLFCAGCVQHLRSCPCCRGELSQTQPFHRAPLYVSQKLLSLCETCNICHQQVPRNDLAIHAMACHPLCPNGCGCRVPVAALKAHEQHHCPNTLLVCPASDFGCQHRSSRDSLALHLRVCNINAMRGSVLPILSGLQSEIKLLKEENEHLRGLLEVQSASTSYQSFLKKLATTFIQPRSRRTQDDEEVGFHYSNDLGRWVSNIEPQQQQREELLLLEDEDELENMSPGPAPEVVVAPVLPHRGILEACYRCGFCGNRCGTESELRWMWWAGKRVPQCGIASTKWVCGGPLVYEFRYSCCGKLHGQEGCGAF